MAGGRGDRKLLYPAQSVFVLRPAYGIRPMLALFFCVAPGAVGGFAYSWRLLSKSTAHNVAVILDVPINPNDKAQRMARARTIGYIKGVRVGACNFTAMSGAVVGLAIWIIWQVAAWLFG